MFALADCNNFFVSCERVFRPDLASKAVVVLSNNDGCAISRSNEAKSMGIKMGEPLFKFRELVESGEVVVFSSNYLLYGDMSKRVQTVLRNESPAIEVYSIDESFLNLSGMENQDLSTWAKKLSTICFKKTGIPISVGVAPTKTLAKVASKLCKQYPKLEGGCYMHRKEDIDKVLATYPIEDIWGIGRRYSTRFKSYYGIKTAGDFINKGEEWIRKEMGIVGYRTYKELLGHPCISFEDNIDARKQICVSRSFSKDLYDFEEISEQASLFCSIAAEKLRKQNTLCNQVIVFIMTNRFKKSEEQGVRTSLITFQTATDSTIQINQSVLSALKEIYHKGIGYKKCGVIFTDIVPNEGVQLSIFDTIEHEKHSKLMAVIDSVNRKNKNHPINLASVSTEGIKMNRKHISPSYTTCWDDIIVVNLTDK